MRVAIVNDMPMALETLRRIVAAAAGLEVAWLAKDGAEAVDKALNDPPDMILMDLIMPVMDGVAATRAIMATSPCPILVVTATVEGNASKVFEAMGNGALDATTTPALGADGQLDGTSDLLAKIQRLARLATPVRERLGGASDSLVANQAFIGPEPFIVAIGASTGGPKAVSRLLAKLPANLPAPVVIVQHIDQRFAPGMAEWLNGESNLPVTAAAAGEYPQKGRGYLAVSNDHLIINPSQAFEYQREPADNPFRPSVDIFFESLAANWRGGGAAVVLTGIGQDGARGILSLRRRGNWRSFAQSEGSCVVFGMPKAAIEIGGADVVGSPEEIAEGVIKLCRGRQ